MSQIILDLRNFSINFGEPKLGPLNLTLKAGRITALIGQHNSRKSLLLNTLAGIHPLVSGSYQIFGKPCHHDQDTLWKQQIGFVPQDPHLYDDLSLEDHLTLFALHYPSWDDRYVQKQVDDFPIKSKVGDLSLKQKVIFSLIAMFAHSPPIMLLEETASGLTPDNRQWLIDELESRVKGDQQCTVLITSDNLADVKPIADEICLLENGKMSRPLQPVELTELGGSGVF